MIKDEQHYFKNALLVVFIFTVFRLIFSGYFNLSPDEANYWQWSRYLDWGYYDHPPIIAWTIRLGTLLFGQTERGVRFVSVFSMAIATLYMVLMAKRWIGGRTAFKVAVLSQSVFLFNLGGLLATPDSPQAACWAGACYHVARAYENDRWRQWLLGGMWFGLGILSKYTMALFLPGAFLYGMFSSQHRSRLAGIKPWAGVLFGFVLFLPVICWNYQNDWSTFRHVAYMGGANEGFQFTLRYFGDFIGSQAALLSPFVFVLFLLSWWFFFKNNNRWIYSYLFFTSFIMFAFFFLLSFKSRVYGNWPGAAYLTGSILMVAFFGAQPAYASKGRLHRFGIRLWPWALVTSYMITAIILLHTVCPFLPIPQKFDRVSRELSGWDKVGKIVEKTRKKMLNPERTFIFGFKYQNASELAFYTPGQPKTVSINRYNRPNVYDFWWEDKDIKGWDGLGIVDDPKKHKKIKQFFKRVDPPEKVAIYRDTTCMLLSPEKKPLKIFYIYRGYGFRGGLRWNPENGKDIRTR